MKYVILFLSMALNISTALGQSAQVVFDVGKQDAAILSVLELSCRTQDSTILYPFNGNQSVEATVQRSTSCWLNYRSDLYVKPRYSYHFGLSGADGCFIPISYSFKDKTNRIIGKESQWESQTTSLPNGSKYFEEESGVVILKPVAVQQLKSFSNINISAHVLDGNYALGRCRIGQIVTYVDGIPVRAQGATILNPVSPVVIDMSWLGTPAEFENANTSSRSW